MKFKCADDKFFLFKFRGKLRSQGIRIANDLIHQDRQELDELKQQGRRGYFSNGKLVVLDEYNTTDTGRFRNREVCQAQRRSFEQPVQAMETIYPEANA